MEVKAAKKEEGEIDLFLNNCIFSKPSRHILLVFDKQKY